MRQHDRRQLANGVVAGGVIAGVDRAGRQALDRVDRRAVVRVEVNEAVELDRDGVVDLLLVGAASSDPRRDGALSRVHRPGHAGDDTGDDTGPLRDAAQGDHVRRAPSSVPERPVPDHPVPDHPVPSHSV